MNTPLTNCPACNHEVSSHAATCPQCGHPLKAAQSAEHLAVKIIIAVPILIGFAWFFWFLWHTAQEAGQ